jgi:hypothetical protein
MADLVAHRPPFAVQPVREAARDPDVDNQSPHFSTHWTIQSSPRPVLVFPSARSCFLLEVS